MERIGALFLKGRTRFFLAALCFALPFHVPFLFPLTFVGAALLFFAAEKTMEKTELRGFFASGFGFAFFYHLLIYHWLLSLHPLTVAGLDGAVSAFVCLLAYLGAVSIHATYFALSFLLWGVLCRTSEKRALRFLFFAICLLFAEGMTLLGALGFPWARFSLPLAEVPFLLSSASLFGPLFCEALLFLFGALVFFAFSHRARLRRVLFAALAALLVLSQIGFGAVHFSVQKAGARTLKVAAVQTAYGFEEKWQTSASDIRAYLYDSTEAAALAGAELVVFPESVLAANMVRDDKNARFFTSLCEEFGVAIAAGSLYVEHGETFNAVCLFDENGLVSYNAKRHLVPFGEYLPHRSLISAVAPAVAEMAYYRSELSVGESGVCGEVDGVTYGGLVCFDTLFSSLAVESVRDGAEVLVAPTNDAWFKDSPAAAEHLLHGVWRAAETGRPLVQAANNGVSAVVDFTGEVLDFVPLSTPEVAVAEVHLPAGESLYVQTGEVLLPACLLFVLGYLVAVFVKKRVGEVKRRG